MTEAEVRKLRRDEGQIAYEVLGEGPLIVCIPGAGDLRSSYRHNMRALSEAGFRVAAMDLRGHGDSDATFVEYDEAAAGDDALSIVMELGGGPAVLVGNSIGAGAAVYAAFERPDIIAGIGLIGPIVRQARSNQFKAWAFRTATSGLWAPAFWDAYLPSLYPGRKPADLDEHRAAIRESMRRPGHARAFTATKHTSPERAEWRLAYVECPALVVMGTADPVFQDPVAEAGWTAERIPDAEQLLIQGTGHHPQAEEPQFVNPALIAFARKTLLRA